MAASGPVKLGACDECGEANLYSALICRHCQARLPWADALEAAGQLTPPAVAANSASSSTSSTSKVVISAPRPAEPPPSQASPHDASATAPQGFLQAAHPSHCDPARVRVSARMLDWPYSCACCGQSLEGPGAVGHKVISVSTRRSLIPYCANCARHIELAVAADNAFGCCVLLAVLGCWPLFTLFQGISGWLEFSLASSALTCGALLIAGYQDRRGKLEAAHALLNPGCCDLRHAVVPAFGLGTSHSFLFKRREYADAFIQANRQKVIG